MRCVGFSLNDITDEKIEFDEVDVVQMNMKKKTFQS